MIPRLGLISLLCAVVAVPRSGGAQVTETRLNAASIPALAPNPSQIADSLFMAMDAGAAMAVLRGHLKNAPDDFDALWRAARAAIVLGILTENRNEKLKWLRAADSAGDRLLALRPGDTLALTWAASAKGRLAMEARNPVTTTRLAQQVWTLTGNLLATRPDNPMGNGIRGKFIQEVRKLSWAERVFARLLLGSDIAGAATWEDSERYLERAVASDPKMVVYQLDLGDTYRLQHKDVLAMEAYRTGLSLPSRYPIDDYYKRRIREGVRAVAGRSDGHT